MPYIYTTCDMDDLVPKHISHLLVMFYYWEPIVEFKCVLLYSIYDFSFYSKLFFFLNYLLNLEILELYYISNLKILLFITSWHSNTLTIDILLKYFDVFLPKCAEYIVLHKKYLAQYVNWVLVNLFCIPEKFWNYDSVLIRSW